ncbi:MAG TPA: glutamine--fructose-6-phosphate transaminase (isomerizing) [Thermodesulfovibrio thiophilus]|nr:glutamine--fructose-6-phosphate transaminase (isomerizing) [Thermodesulfovibrio thiophilus]HQA03342.1 glutamine--fructose-6-phosphate transaminase (isomerizing) [Thermodesulfovibrio thiophilus]HQD35752.1 glutamine--fructose-6-phosphate transaminase (isomerizing) [Thermodesulfovibrio thiophilus]
MGKEKEKAKVMCGIIGYIGNKNAINIVLEGLKKLEYRGYDSAGLAFVNDSQIEIVKCKGKISNLESLIKPATFSTSAIGHTRWATHGKPSDENAHPHTSSSIALVHNGIIENYIELKKELEAEGYKFNSETDTEVIAHLIGKYREELSLVDAVRKACLRLRGSYAIVLIDRSEPDMLIGVRMESPLVIGVSDEERFIASDIPAFLNYCRNVVFLEDGEMVLLSKEGFKIYDLNGEEKEKKVHTIAWTPSMAEKDGFKHYMLKEIYEQPRAIADTIRGRVLSDGEVVYEEWGLMPQDMKEFERLYLVACGTSYHACLIGKYMIEEMCELPVEVDIASEFRYRKVPFGKNSLFVAVTQSGETADTLAALRYAKKSGIKTLSICNVIGSTVSRESDYIFYTRSGPEIGVASTKAFTSQVVAFYILSLALALSRGKISKEMAQDLVIDLMALPRKIEDTLKLDTDIQTIVKEVYRKPNFLYLGRGINYPVALEGALKLKEISYIHAEGYAAGEMKHGPIALIEENFPVVFITSNGSLLEKTISNIQEIKARDGFVITITDANKELLNRLSDKLLYIEGSNPYLNPVIFTVPLQLFAYYIAVLRGCDVDQPRNLAKSVTVE